MRIGVRWVGEVWRGMGTLENMNKLFGVGLIFYGFEF